MVLAFRTHTFFGNTLTLDPENVTAHYNLDLLYKQLGDPEQAATHFEAYLEYKPDDNARDRAVALARRRDPAANHAAEAIVIYDLDSLENKVPIAALDAQAPAGRPGTAGGE